MLEIDVEIKRDFDLIRNLNRRFPNQPTCAETILKAMRLAELNARRLHEFSYVVEGMIVCTTTLGQVSEPIPQAQESVKAKFSDVEFSLSVPILALGGNTTSMQVRIGGFQAFIRSLPIDTMQMPWLQTGVYAITEKGVQSVLQPLEVQPRAPFQGDNPRWWIEGGRWVEQYCYGSGSCGLVVVNIPLYLSHRQEIVLVTLMFFALIAGLIGLVIWHAHKRYMEIGRQLKRSLTYRTVDCVYQPIFRLDNGHLEGCEVLCRWRDENNQQIRPDVFIGEIARNGQTRQLTEIVIKKAVDELTVAGLFGRIRMAVNTFPDDIASGHVDRILTKVLSGQSCQSVTVEVTEQEASNVGEVAKNIEQLRNKSIRLAIDDFGTGYSNFQHLEKLNVDYLKIDQSFVRGMETNALRSHLIKSITEMAGILGLQTVAEGVELQAQFDALKALGVSYSQGYLHAKPMPISDFANYVKQHKISDIG